MSLEKPYKPSPAEIQKAEDSMDYHQKEASTSGKRVEEMQRFNDDREAFETNFTPEQLQTMAKLEDAGREIDNETKATFEKKFGYKKLGDKGLEIDTAYSSGKLEQLTPVARAEAEQLALKHESLYRLGLIAITNTGDPRHTDAIGEKVRNFKNLFGLKGGESRGYASFHAEPFESGVPMLNGPEEMTAMLAVKDEIEKRSGEQFASLFTAIKNANEKSRDEAKAA